MQRLANHVHQPDHFGTLEDVANGVDVLAAGLHLFGLTFPEQTHSASNVADVQRLIVLVEHQNPFPDEYSIMSTHCKSPFLLNGNLHRTVT